MPNNRLTNISLFSGAGGLDIGLHQAGFLTKVCVENDSHCHETLETNRHLLGHEEMPVLGDITMLSPSDLLEYSGLRREEVDLVSGGPPCQAFSTAGHRGSVNDPRGRLFLDFVKIVESIRPRFFVMENVRGLRSAALKHRPLNQRGNDFPDLSEEEELGSMLNLGILPEFQRIGYQVVWGELNALDYGSAQDRRRLLFIGSRDTELPSETEGPSDLSKIVPPTYSRDLSSGISPVKVLKDVILDLEDDPGPFMPYSPNRAKVFERIPEGRNWRWMRDSDDFSQQELEDFMGGAYTSTGGRVGFWRRLSWDKWSPTLTTSPVQKATGLCHPTKNRPLSVREYARIQGFPDDWTFSGPVASQYRQIGNAVPVELAVSVGKAVADLISAREPMSV
jgi:DNA (cytosine-5)-methyltransferase 1